MGKIFWPVVIVVGLLWLMSSTDELPSLDESFETETAEAVSEPVPEPEIAAEDTWAPPEGFTYWRDDGTVAWRWVEGLDCPSYSDGCWHVDVVTRDGCPDGVYVSLNKLNADETVVGYTNDTLPVLEAGQVGRLTLTASSDDGEVSGRVAEIDCH